MTTQPRGDVFLSYGRRDTRDLPSQLASVLRNHFSTVWLDREQIEAGRDWRQEIAQGLLDARVVVAVVTPHSVRRAIDADDGSDSTCLNEIAYAVHHRIPVVPVMAARCELPFSIAHLDYVDMVGWDTSPDVFRRGVDRIVQGIHAALRGERRYRSWYAELKPWDFENYLVERRRGFHGRKWLFEEIHDWLESKSHERALLIRGEPGTGKSAVVAQLVLDNPDGRMLAYHCCQIDTPATLNPGRMVRSLAALIASRLPDYAAQLESVEVRDALTEVNCEVDPASAFEVGVLIPLARLTPFPDTRYILVDALDEALAWRGPTESIVHLFANRVDRFPSWVRLVATTRNEPDVLNRLRGVRNRHIELQDSRNLEDIDGYLRERLLTPPLRDKLKASHRTVEEVAAILHERSQGLFLFVRQALEGLERDVLSLQHLDELPPGLFGLYEHYFDRQFADQQAYAAARRVLEAVVAAQEPLTADQLVGVTGLGSDDELGNTLRLLASFVPARVDESGSRYAVFHKSLSEWLTSGAPEARSKYSINVLHGHERHAELHWLNYRRDVHSVSRYGLRYLAAHLREAGRTDDLFVLARDPVFAAAQEKAFPGEPGLRISTLEAALDAMDHLDDATGMAEFVLAIASRVAHIRQQSPLEVGRNGDWDRAHRLLDLMPVKERVLWALLLAAEHLEHGRRSEATELVNSLRQTKVPRLILWEAPFAADCLADLADLDRDTFYDLSERLFGEHHPQSFWRSLVDRRHFEAALERVRRRGTWLDVQNVLKYEIERQVTAGDYAAAWRLLFSATGWEQPDCAAEIAHAQSTAGYTSVALEQLELVAPALRVNAYIKLAHLGEPANTVLFTQRMLKAAASAARQVGDGDRLQALVDLAIAKGLHGDLSTARAELIDLLHSQHELSPELRVHALIGLAKLGDVVTVMDVLGSASEQIPLYSAADLIVEVCRHGPPAQVGALVHCFPENSRAYARYEIARAYISLGSYERAREAMDGAPSPHLAAEYTRALCEGGRWDDVDLYLHAQTAREYQSAALSSVAAFKGTTGDLFGAVATLDQITDHAWKVVGMLRIVTDLAARHRFEEALMIAAKNQGDYGYEDGRYPHLMRTIASNQWLAGEHDASRTTMAAILTGFAADDSASHAAQGIGRIASARIRAHDWVQADRILPLITDDEERRRVRLAYAEARLAAADFDVVAELAAATEDAEERTALLRSLSRSHAEAGSLDDALRTAGSIPWVLSRLDTLHTIAPALRQAHRLEDAIASVDAAMRIVRSLPEHPAVLAKAYSLLSRIQHELGMDDMARETSMAALDTGRRIPDHELRGPLLREIGEALAAVGAPDAAADAFRDAASAYMPSSALLYLPLVTEAMVTAGLTEPALNLIDRADFLLQSGMFDSVIQVLVQRGDYDRALAITVERGGPDLPRAINRIVTAYATQGRFEEALILVAHLRTEVRYREEALSIISGAFADHGRPGEALDTMANVASGYYRAVSLARIGVAQFKEGDTKSARATLAAALGCARSIADQASNRPAGGFVDIAKAYVEIGDLREAADAAFEDVAGYDLPRLLADIAFAMIKAGNIAEGCSVVLRLPDRKREVLTLCTGLMAESKTVDALKRLLPAAARDQSSATAACADLAAIYVDRATAIAEMLAARDGAKIPYPSIAN